MSRPPVVDWSGGHERLASARYGDDLPPWSHLDDQRKITEQTRVSWNSVTTSHENVIELQKTVVANTQTRDAYIQQFDIGQRGLLDLLNEDNELYLSKDNLVTATFAEVFARFRLLAVAGGLEKALSVSPPEQAAVPVEQ